MANRPDRHIARLASLLSGRPLAKALITEAALREFARKSASRIGDAIFAQAQRLGQTTKLLPPPEPNRAEFPFVASLVYRGIPIDLEQRKGDVREGVDRDGTPWRVTMAAHYGEVRSHARGASGVMGARGMDGDRLDVYVGDAPASDLVVVVDQRIPETGEHDEQKVMLGFETVAEALACYRKQYTKPGFYGGHTTMGIDDFRSKIADPSNAGKALKKAPAPVGTVHTWADGRRHRKTPDGWVEVRTVSPAKPVRTGAVPVSDALVDNIADEVIDIVRRGGDGDDRVATVRPREFATHVRTADGELVHVTVRVALNALSRRGVTGRMSFYAERKDDGQRTQSRRGLIQISVGEEGLFGSSARELRERIKSTLSHELTHAADPAVRLNFESQASRGAKIVGSRDVLRDEGREAYINDEGEVTARIQQIIRELRQSKNVDRIKADMADHASDPDAMPRPGVVAWEIQESPTWMKIESQLNEDNRRRVLRAVARVVRGIMDGSVTPLAKALAALPPGSLLLPEAHGRLAFFSQLMKGKAHRYIKRVPIPGKFTKKGTPRYRYFYHVARGAGGVHAQEHFVEGAGFMAQGGHWHIRAVDGDRLTIEHDENGQSRTVTKAELSAMLHAEHRAGIEKHEADKKERATKRLEADRAEAAVYGTDKHRARLGLPTKAEELKRHQELAGPVQSLEREHARAHAEELSRELSQAGVPNRVWQSPDGSRVRVYIGRAAVEVYRDGRIKVLEPDRAGRPAMYQSQRPKWAEALKAYQAGMGARLMRQAAAHASLVAPPASVAEPEVMNGPTKAEEAARAAQKKPAPDEKTAQGLMESIGVDAMVQRINDATITAAEVRRLFDATVANKAAIMAQLAKLTKPELQRIVGSRAYADEKKDRLVESAWHSILGSFHVSSSTQWSPFSETYDAAITREVDKLTDEAIAAYSARRKKAIEEHKARIGAVIEPKTLADFKTRISLSREGERSLTPEQRVRYDELVAEDARAQAQKEHEDAHAARAKAAQERTALAGSALATETTAKVIPGKHTKHGHDIWTVQLADRLAPDEYAKANAHAKSIGGYYSSFRGNGAIPGFVFKTDAAARQFADKFGGGEAAQVAEPVTEPEKPGPLHGNAPARLREQADNAHARAQESLSADRKVNTARRANMAGNAEAQAMGEQAVASRMRLIADAQDAGSTKHLWGIKTRAHVEMLDNILRQAKYDRDRATREAGGKADHNETSHRAVTSEDIEHARPPEPSVHRDNMKGLAQALKDVPGAKQAAARVLKRISQLGEREWQLRATTEQERDDFKALSDAGRLRRVETFAADDVRDQLTIWKRASEGMGIKSLPQLRAALREYVEITRGSNKAKPDPIKAAERALVGLKIPGYFPTPKPLADRVMQLADIKPGEKVLEPSAGKGSLADLAREQGGDVHVLEQHSGLRDVLSLKGHKVVGHDATEHAETYDKVVMNPPFENGQDIDHVQHAFENNLKPGGKLVAIMSEGPFFRSDKKAQAFREWLESHGGTSEKNPEGSFKDSDNSTGVATRTVVITKALPASEASGNHRKYGRDDIDYDDWYPSWMKQLARSYSRDELVRMLGKTGNEAARAASSHHAAIAKTTGMQSQSQRRAQTGNVSRGLGDRAIAIRGALEIHDLFPEHAKGSASNGRDPSHTAKLDEKIARLEREVARLGGETSHDKAMAEAFPLGAGSMRPTGQRTGAARRSAERRMDASIDAAKRHVEAVAELKAAKTRRAAYVEGRVNEQGRAIKVEPVKPVKPKAPRSPKGVHLVDSDGKALPLTPDKLRLVFGVKNEVGLSDGSRLSLDSRGDHTNIIITKPDGRQHQKAERGDDLWAGVIAMVRDHEAGRLEKATRAFGRLARLLR